MISREQVFTDDDLARLKERIGEDPYASKYVDCVEYEKLKALLARLEAAEANMGGHSPDCPRAIGKCICTKESRDRAWRESAGKLKGVRG